jgi:uncharacterized membrane-anchored protein YhcB (DUF1043 family)
MNRIVHLIIHPLFLSIVLGALAILSLPPVFQKFEAQITDSKTFSSNNQTICYHDFDHDGNSERIILSYNSIHNNPIITIIDHNGYICDEWPILKGHWLPHERNIFFGDYNHNGQDEVYAITVVNDSLFLNGIEPFGSKQFVVKQLFITKGKLTGKKIDLVIYNGILCDLNHDGFKEVVLALIAGYNLQPRAVFAIDLAKDSVFRSPLAYLSLFKLHTADLDQDGYPELFGTAIPLGNTGLSVPLSDSLSWLIVLDHTLHYKFGPFPINEYPGGASTLKYVFDKKPMLIVLSKYTGSSTNNKNKLYLFTPQGKRIDSITLKKEIYHLNRFQTKHYNNILLSSSDADGHFSIYKINNHFKLKKIFHQQAKLFLMDQCVDIDGNGYPEFLLTKRTSLSDDNTSLVIRDHNFKNPVEIALGYIETGKKIISVVHLPNGKNFLSIQFGKKWFKIEYRRNPLYPFRFFIYGLIFILLYAFFALLFRLQKQAIEKQHKNEKDLSELQLKTIKNQLDPHFALNILNAIGSLIGQNNTEKANELFGKYSKLTRHILLGANEISTSLFDELVFVRDYLELEQFRHANRFTFYILADDNIQLKQVFLPRMLVHTFAENAVKHGLRHLDTREGNLEIRVLGADKAILVSIVDNGIGREESKKHNQMSTGKGLHIAREMVALYNKLQQTHITFELTDLPQGLKVVIRIPANR